MSTQIGSLSIKIQSSSRGATNAIDKLVASLEKLQTASGAGGLSASLNKIALAMDRVKASSSEGNRAIGEMGKALKKTVSPFSQATKSADSFSSAADNAADNSEKLGGSLGNAISGLLQFAGNALGIHSVGQGLAYAAAQAREWEGISARFGEGFGDQVDEAYAHVQKLSDALYINDQVFMQYSSNFATLARGFGVTESAIANMSIGLTELAYDIYAKNNDFYTFEEALMAVRSAFVGEIEPIRLAGISITEATLKEAAANYGLTTSVENMTEAQKAMLRYKVMVDQAYASGTVGTYIQEINTVEGSSRALGQQLKGLAQTIGAVLMPVIAAVMPYIQAFVSLVTMAIRAIAGLFGISVKAPTWTSGMDSLAGSAGGATDAVDKTTSALGGASKAAKKLKDYTMGFDELNVIKPQDASSGGGGGGGGGLGGGDLGLDIDSLWTDAMIESANLKADEIAQNIIKFLQPLRDAINAIDWNPLIDSAVRLWDALKPFAATIGEGLYWFLVNVLVPLAGYTIENVIPAFLNSIAAVLEWLTPQLKDFGAWFVENKEHIATVAALLVSLWLGFKGASALAGVFGGFDKFANVLTAVTKALFGNKAALSSLTFMFPKASKAFSSVVGVLKGGKGLTGLFSLLGSSMSGVLAVAAPIVAVVVAIAGVALVLAANWDKVVAIFQAFIKKIDLAGKFEAIKAALSPMMEKLAGLKDIFTVIGVVVLTALQPAIAVVMGLFNGLLSMIAPLITALGGLIDFIAGIGSVIVGLFTGDMEKVTEGLQKMFSGVGDILRGLWEAVAGFFVGFIDGVLGWIGGLLEGIGVDVDGCLTAIGNFFVNAWLGIQTAWSGVTTWFGDILTDIQVGWAIIETWFSDLFTNTWTGIQTAWSSVLTWFSDLWASIQLAWSSATEWFSTLFTNAWTSITDAWSSVTTWFSDTWSDIKTTWDVVRTWFGTRFTLAWSSIKTAWASVVTWFSGKWSSIKTTFSSVDTWFKGKFEDAWTAIKNVFASWGTFFSDLWTSISTTFTDLGTTIGDAVGSAVKTGVNGAIRWIENTINSAISSINSVIRKVNSWTGYVGLTISELPTVSIPQLADGGFVDAGQLFIAREAGAEMVGSMNGHTAVANNDQIVEGISQGVYSAVVAAMSDSNGDGTMSVNVYLDGKRLTQSIEKYQRQRGANIMKGGVTYGY